MSDEDLYYHSLRLLRNKLNRQQRLVNKTRASLHELIAMERFSPTKTANAAMYDVTRIAQLRRPSAPQQHRRPVRGRDLSPGLDDHRPPP